MSFFRFFNSVNHTKSIYLVSPSLFQALVMCREYNRKGRQTYSLSLKSSQSTGEADALSVIKKYYTHV